MPKFTIPDVLRYFIFPIAIYVCLFVYDEKYLFSIQDKLSLLGAIAGLVSGCAVYFLYRFYIYDHLVRWVIEACPNSSYRMFVQKRYALPKPGFPSSSSWEARFICDQLDLASEGSPNRQLRASGIHLLYQAGVTALVFSGLAFVNNKGWPLACSFFGSGLIFLWAALRMDWHYEREELMFLKQNLDKLDKVAASNLVAKRPT